MRFRPCIDIHNGRVKQIIAVSYTHLDVYKRQVLTMLLKELVSSTQLKRLRSM